MAKKKIIEGGPIELGNFEPSSEKVLYIYTDFGGEERQRYGLGVLFIDDEYETKFQFRTSVKLLNKEFGTKDKGNSTIGETYAILKALQNLPKKKFDKYVIYTDSWGAVLLLNGVNKQRKENKLLFAIKDKIDELNINFEVCWVPGHSNIYGNEICDKLARVWKNTDVPYCNDNKTDEWELKLYDFDFNNYIHLNEMPTINSNINIEKQLNKLLKETLIKK